MAGTLKFNREFAEFGPQIRNFEKADDVGLVVTEFMWDGGVPFYSIGNLMGARINAVPLGDGDPPSEELIDLVFRMPTGVEGSFYYEIVLRVEGGAAYAGWLFGETVSVRDEVVNGHRVLETIAGGETLRYTYDLQSGRYLLDPSTLTMTTAPARRIAKRRR
jgi:hypothetical protein